MRVLTRVPNLGLLLALREVARSGSFSEAAGTLGISQSAISQRVAVLERQVGLRLVDRARGRVGLTVPGRLLVARVENALAHLSAADIELDSYRASPAPGLRVGAFAAAMWRLLPEAVALFRAASPGLGVTVRRAEPDRAVSALKAGELDLALIFETPAALADVADGVLEAAALFDERAFVALPADHRLAARPILSPADLASERWVQSPHDGAVVVGGDQMAQPVSRLDRTDDDGTAIGFTAARLGLALVGELRVPILPEGVVVRELVPQPTRRRVAVVGLAVRRVADATSPMRAALRQAALRHLVRVGRPRSDLL